jgi:xanthine dehydrogenase accessory factor
MRDILSDLAAWKSQGKSIALATVVGTWGSSPRPTGSRMGFTAEGDITGSVSGGCVEAAVIEAGLKGLRSGQPQLLHFSVPDETAWGVGLTCGGSLDVSSLDVNLFQALQICWMGRNLRASRWCAAQAIWAQLSFARTAHGE